MHFLTFVIEFYLKYTLITITIFRCDDSENLVNLELCVENYIENSMQCHYPTLFTGNNSYPLCDEEQTRKITEKMEDIGFLGEQEIYRMTGCLSKQVVI